MAALKQIRSVLDSLPFIATLLLVLLVNPIYGGLYRLGRGDTMGIILGVIWFLTGGFMIGWIMDIISVILHKKLVYLV